MNAVQPGRAYNQRSAGIATFQETGLPYMIL